jgi:hypothetical protein
VAIVVKVDFGLFADAVVQLVADDDENVGVTEIVDEHFLLELQHGLDPSMHNN